MGGVLKEKTGGFGSFGSSPNNGGGVATSVLLSAWDVAEPNNGRDEPETPTPDEELSDESRKGTTSGLFPSPETGALVSAEDEPTGWGVDWFALLKGLASFSPSQNGFSTSLVGPADADLPKLD